MVAMLVWALYNARTTKPTMAITAAKSARIIGAFFRFGVLILIGKRQCRRSPSALRHLLDPRPLFIASPYRREIRLRNIKAVIGLDSVTAGSPRRMERSSRHQESPHEGSSP